MFPACPEAAGEERSKGRLMTDNPGGNSLTAVFWGWLVLALVALPITFPAVLFSDGLSPPDIPSPDMDVSSRFGRIVSNYRVFFLPTKLFRKDGIGTVR